VALQYLTVIPDRERLDIGGAVEVFIIGTKVANLCWGLASVHDGLEGLVLIEVRLQNKGGNKAILGGGNHLPVVSWVKLEIGDVVVVTLDELGQRSVNRPLPKCTHIPSKTTNLNNADT